MDKTNIIINATPNLFKLRQISKEFALYMCSLWNKQAELLVKSCDCYDCNEENKFSEWVIKATDDLQKNIDYYYDCAVIKDIIE